MSKTEQKPIYITSTGTTIAVLDDDTLSVEKLALATTDGTAMAFGYSDGTISFTGSTAYNDSNFSKILTYYKNIGGTKTKVFEADVDYFDVGEFAINVTTCTSPIFIEYTVYGS